MSIEYEKNFNGWTIKYKEPIRGASNPVLGKKGREEEGI